MAIKSLQHSSITDNIFYRSMLAGNTAFDPGDEFLLEEQVLSSSAASVTFSGLEQYAGVYQHLQIVVVGRASLAGASVGVYSRLNADSGSNYNGHFLLGNGSAVSSGTTGTATWGLSGLISANAMTAGNFGAAVIDLLDPFETTKNKTLRTLGGATEANRIDLHSALWMNTASVTSWTLYPEAFNWLTGSRFSLYGAK